MPVLRNRETKRAGTRPFSHAYRVPRQQVAEEKGRRIHLIGIGPPPRSMIGDLERLALFAGQSAGMVERVEPAAAAVERALAEAVEAIAGFPCAAGGRA